VKQRRQAVTRSRFRSKEFIAIVKELQPKLSAKVLCRRHETIDRTIYEWRSKFIGTEMSTSIRQRTLECGYAGLEGMLGNDLRGPVQGRVLWTGCSRPRHTANLRQAIRFIIDLIGEASCPRRHRECCVCKAVDDGRNPDWPSLNGRSDTKPIAQPPIKLPDLS